MTSRNETLFAAAQRHIPGGVNSPVRAFRGVGGTPRFFASGKGPRVTDADGKVYIDYVGSWGPLILGHADPDVLEAGLASDDATVRLAVHLLYFTGQRIGDVMKMRWGDIRGGYIYVKQTKTKKIVEPPLSAELKAELDRTPKTAVTIVTGINEGQLRRKLQAFTAGLGAKTVPHGLRKNAVNALLEAGCTIAEVSAITGQTHQVVEHYAAKVNRKKLGGAAIYKLDSARGKTA